MLQPLLQNMFGHNILNHTPLLPNDTVCTYLWKSPTQPSGLVFDLSACRRSNSLRGGLMSSYFWPWLYVDCHQKSSFVSPLKYQDTPRWLALRTLRR